MKHQPALSTSERKTMLCAIRDFALRKAIQFVETDDPARSPVMEFTRAQRLQMLVNVADTADQMIDNTKA